MPPHVALLIWLVLLVALFRFDPARVRETSLALWLPVIWMFIVGSRLPSQWLGLVHVGVAAQVLQEGNPLDRTVFTILILLSIFVLVVRGFHWGDFFQRNWALMLFILFALASVAWSDYRYVTFKRWFRDLGGYVVVLVALTDTHPLEGVRTVLRRLSYLLVPLSIVFVKYYPGLGRDYSSWTGAVTYQGVATSKNMLGVLCLVSGLFFFWDTVVRWAERKDRQTKRIILVNLAFLAMTLWLLNKADSATSSVCLVLGCLVIAAAHTNAAKRSPGFLKIAVPASFFLYVILAWGFNLSGQMAEAVGRNANLTDRTFIWKTLLGMHTNPLVGTGYESFWLGARLQTFWNLSGIHINEAHNGYLQVYLELGLIGLFLLGLFLIASYWTICKRLKPFSIFGSLSLALFVILLFYNVTETAFENQLIWGIFLFVAIAVDHHVKRRVFSEPTYAVGPTEDPAGIPFEPAAQQR